MAGPSTLNLDFTALLTSTLMKQSKDLNDQISSANYFFYRLNEIGAIKETADLGERYKVNLMYGLAPTDTFAGYDLLPVDPVDGLTAAFFDWRNAVTPISISGDEKRKNRGSMTQIINLLTAKTKQAKTSITEFWGKAFLQGNGINNPTAVTTAYTSPTNGSTFIDPLPLLVKYDPTTGTVGNINAANYDWWRNQALADSSSTFAGFRKNLRHLFNQCGLGNGGGRQFPDIHLVDQNVYEFYEEMLTFFYRNTSAARADIPYQNLSFKGFPVTWDQYVIDAANGSTTQSASSGTWYMLNSDCIELMADSQTNFKARPAVEPANQDASISQILWTGASAVNQRRKHGVMGSIDTTITS